MSIKGVSGELVEKLSCTDVIGLVDFMVSYYEQEIPEKHLDDIYNLLIYALEKVCKEKGPYLQEYLNDLSKSAQSVFSDGSKLRNKFDSAKAKLEPKDLESKAEAKLEVVPVTPLSDFLKGLFESGDSESDAEFINLIKTQPDFLTAKYSGGATIVHYFPSMVFYGGDVCDALFENKPDLSVQSDEGTPIHSAAYNIHSNNAYVFSRFVAEGRKQGFDFNKVRDVRGKTVLHAIVTAAEPEHGGTYVGDLLEAVPDLDLEVAASDGLTALQIAMKRDNPETIRALVAQGANVKEGNGSGLRSLNDRIFRYLIMDKVIKRFIPENDTFENRAKDRQIFRDELLKVERKLQESKSLDKILSKVLAEHSDELQADLKQAGSLFKPLFDEFKKLGIQLRASTQNHLEMLMREKPKFGLWGFPFDDVAPEVSEAPAMAEAESVTWHEEKADAPLSEQLQKLRQEISAELDKIKQSRAMVTPSSVPVRSDQSGGSEQKAESKNGPVLPVFITGGGTKGESGVSREAADAQFSIATVGELLSDDGNKAAQAAVLRHTCVVQ